MDFQKPNHPEGIRTRLGAVAWLAIIATTIGAAALVWRALARESHAEAEPVVPPNWVIGSLPFICLLLAIAVLPMLRGTQQWWHSNRNRLFTSIVFAGLTLLYYTVIRSPAH